MSAKIRLSFSGVKTGLESRHELQPRRLRHDAVGFHRAFRAGVGRRGVGGRRLEASRKIVNSHPMSKVEEIQSEIGKLSAREKQEIRDWLENILEDQLELREEFKSKIEQSERDMAAGRQSRVHRPDSGS